MEQKTCILNKRNSELNFLYVFMRQKESIKSASKGVAIDGDFSPISRWRFNQEHVLLLIPNKSFIRGEFPANSACILST